MSSSFLGHLLIGVLGCLLIREAAAAPAPGAKVPSEWDPSGPAVAIAADLSAEAGRTKLVLTLSRAVTARAFLLERPDRAIIDLPEVNFQLPPETARRKAGLVASFRYGMYAPGRSRIVIDLAQPALVSSVDVTTRALDGAVLLSVELTRTERATFRSALGRDDGLALRSTVAAPSAPDDRRPVIAIDAGHGGIDPGATAANGVVEKDLVFGFAQMLRARLEQSGRYRVAMTRDRDIFVPLDERVRRGRAAGADLFISIHADTIAAGQVRGATVYTGSEQASDAESAVLADRENSADSQAGFVGTDQPEEVAGILQDLMLRETRGFSHRFSGQLIHELGPITRLNKAPQRQAGFRVLRAPDIPSVLLELGYLSSAQDMDLLTSNEWRERSTAAIAAAIDRFFAGRATGGRTAVVSP
jgi:N-acetylmuramoyl-L-alanine amidase